MINLKDKKIIVTGGAGFIGSAIVNKLAEYNCFVNIIDRFPEESIWRIKDKEKCRFFNVDLRNRCKLEECINIIKPEIIFHLAGYVNPERDIKVIQKAYSVNLMGTQNLILALMDYEYDLFINTGSSDEYGDRLAPFVETYKEKPVSPYSASKVATNYFCDMIAHTYEKPIITVRPSLAYGPSQIAKLLIPWLIYSGLNSYELILTPCQQTRDFIYIDDLAEAYISLAKNAKQVSNGGIFNIGAGEEIKILKIVNLIRSMIKNSKFIVGGKPYRSGEAMHFYNSIEKIKKTIGWIPKWKIEDGIKETIKWWKNNQEIWMRYRNIWL